MIANLWTSCLKMVVVFDIPDPQDMRAEQIFGAARSYCWNTLDLVASCTMKKPLHQYQPHLVLVAVDHSQARRVARTLFAAVALAEHQQE